ncbi:MAG TPA: 7-carboxy-7-deazaguanine synthase QueE [Puia sp.]|jgi:7-carboxy-7-deazaguanine synthase|nr:7-carboxy-7-deazaguanine synthase QueE [Puia sp.]
METNKSIEALPVMESFYTLQGEGFHRGKAAFFIRLAGCDVGCVWCDVKDSWDEEKHSRRTIGALVSEAGSHPGRIAVITGGEPLMHDCSGLTTALHDAGFATHIETSGAWPLSGAWDWICLSPKKFKAPLPDIPARAHELKIIIYNQSDFDWAEQWAERTGPRCRLFLQPEWSRSAVVTPLIVDYIKAHPKWEFSLQLHKYIHVP